MRHRRSVTTIGGRLLGPKHHFGAQQIRKSGGRMARRLARWLFPNTAESVQDAVRWMAAREFPRAGLHRIYAGLSTSQLAIFHARFAKVFRGYNGRFDDGIWEVNFLKKTIRIPLMHRAAWLSWDAALSVLGHEVEIKQTYATLIGLPSPPKLVLDIGANYGTHTILFLVHGIRTISFEPNPRCHEFFVNLCAQNEVTPQLEPLALGSGEDELELWFPETEEWLGTVDPAVQRRLATQGAVAKIPVRLTTVDAYVQKYSLRPDVLKIDTEGNELNVFTGSTQTLKDCRPLVIFESWKEEGRMAAFEFLSRHSYAIFTLPLKSTARPRELNEQEFRSTGSTNFLASHTETLARWPPEFK